MIYGSNNNNGMDGALIHTWLEQSVIPLFAQTVHQIWTFPTYIHLWLEQYITPLFA